MSQDPEIHVYEPTALHVAVANGREEAALLLIQKGADIEAINEQGLTPLDVAREKGLQSVIFAAVSSCSQGASAIGIQNDRG
jgi:ankyrin repeat protein